MNVDLKFKNWDFLSILLKKSFKFIKINIIYQIFVIDIITKFII